MKKRAHVWMKGAVQGVFFRQNIKENAERIGVKGWVRNINSEVEAVFEGEHDAVRKMLEFCKKGPSFARVEKVDVKDETFTGEFKEFKVLHF